MILTDVPVSGIYFQEGSIVELVVQLIDATTGLPLQLQTATGLSISIGYPDTLTTLTVPAQLYTDGSDGMIYYVTKNITSQIDLSQIGLYQMQGSAVIGGIQQPQSLEVDFYVLPNVSSSGTAPNAYTASALILFDSNGTRWAGTVSPEPSSFTWVATPSGPSNFVEFSPLVMQDSNGVYWTFSISTLGVVTSVQGGTYGQAVNSLTLIDSNGLSHVITASTAGVLTPS